MYESVNRMLPLLIQGRATLASSRDNTKKEFGKSDNGILEILKRICEVYGLGGKEEEKVMMSLFLTRNIERNVHDGGTLDALQGQEDGSDKNVGDGVRGAVAKEPLRFGWPKLQIDILRQCIAIAEALPGNTHDWYYSLLVNRVLNTSRLWCCSLLYHCTVEESISVYLQGRADSFGNIHPKNCSYGEACSSSRKQCQLLGCEYCLCS